MELLFESLWGLLLWLCVGLLAVSLALRDRRKFARWYAAAEADVTRAEGDFKFLSHSIDREQSGERFCGQCRLFATGEAGGRFPNSPACPGFDCAHSEVRQFPGGSVLCGVCGAVLTVFHLPLRVEPLKGVRSEGRGGQGAPPGSPEVPQDVSRASTRLPSDLPSACDVLRGIESPLLRSIRRFMPFGGIAHFRNLLTGRKDTFRARIEPKQAPRAFIRVKNPLTRGKEIILPASLASKDFYEKNALRSERCFVPAVCSGCGARIPDLSVLPGIEILCPNCAAKEGG